MSNPDQLQADIERLLCERKALRRQIAALKAAKETYCPNHERDIADKAPFGILVVKAFSILYANRACTELFGCPHQPNLNELELMSFLAPSSWPEAAQLLQSIKPEELSAPHQRELVGRRMDGSEFPLTLTIVNISWNSSPAFLCYLSDIAAKKNHEISIMKSMARRRMLREMANISVWDWNAPAGTLKVETSLQPVASPSDFISDRRMLTRLLIHINSRDRRHIRRSIFAALRSGQLETAPFRYHGRDGNLHWAVLNGQCIYAQNHLSGMVGIVRDVTAACQSNRALSLAQQEAQSAGIAKQQFIRNISHELRTPLNGILGMLQLMQQETVSEDFTRYLSMAAQSGKNLLQTINDVLELVDTPDEEPPVHTSPFAPLEFLLGICENFRLDADNKHIELQTNFDLSPNSQYIGDKERIEQILRNLIANSIKFTSKGFIEITSRILIKNEEKHRLLFTITDTGIGIPDNCLAKIFEPFTQADTSNAREHQGVGVGLGIVRKHINRLGGTLSVSSEEHVGTSICFTLDLQPIAPPAKTTLPASSRGQSSKILLAEDNPINQVLAETVLQQMGYEVRPVQNGKEVLQALEEDEFGCILMDIQMPEMSGIEATRRIRESGAKYAGVPIIALTAHALQSDRDKFLDCGMTGYLAKPISITALKEAVTKALENREA